MTRICHSAGNERRTGALCVSNDGSVVWAAILAQKQHIYPQILGPVSHHMGYHTRPLAPQIAMLENNSPMTSDIGKLRKGGHCMHPRVGKGTFCKHDFFTPQNTKHSVRSCTRWWCVGSNRCRPGRSLPGEPGKTPKPRLFWVISDIWSLQSSHHPRRTVPEKTPEPIISKKIWYNFNQNNLQNTPGRPQKLHVMVCGCVLACPA